MKQTLSLSKFLFFSVISIVIISFSSCFTKQSSENQLGQDWQPNRAYQWGEVILEATARDTERFNPRPSVTSRILGLIATSMYDAWSRFDEVHKPLYLQEVPRVSPSMRTLENKEIAISYAAYRTALEYFFSDSLLLTEFMLSLGLDPMDDSLDSTTAVGIGNLAAKAVIEIRKSDGSNHYGELDAQNRRYTDYMGYQPVNDPYNNVDINRWQPKLFDDGKGGKYAPGCLTPYWQAVSPLLLDSASQFRSPPPPLYGSAQLAEEIAEVVELQANLTPEQIALVEFMRDGPKSVQQAGHWWQFAQVVSERDRHTLDQDVVMYFLVQAVAMDAFVACWDTKMHYDYARPQPLIHKMFEGKTIVGWKGPNQGFGEIDGSEWIPYSPPIFTCPPFPAYVSGHSTVSGGCAEILRLYKGDDRFGHSVRKVPGLLTEPESVWDTVTLEMPTFTETAEMAGISRVLGGYHIQVDNVEGLKMGRSIAAFVWEKYQGMKEPEDSQESSSK
jgi:hypothetical protein